MPFSLPVRHAVSDGFEILGSLTKVKRNLLAKEPLAELRQ
jgi:hypothetical protein